MFALFTDFGSEGPYMGQLEAVLHRDAPGIPVVRLMGDVPAFNAKAGAHLLAALIDDFPSGTVFVCVVDPGVGSARAPLILKADGQWFVGPDNGLLDTVAARAAEFECHRILWQPLRLSASFHGRDLFAPVAAMLVRGAMPESEPFVPAGVKDAGNDLCEIIYIDHYGNAVSGVRAASVRIDAVLEVSGRSLHHAGTFSDVGVGELFWYENSNGLIEIAANRASATEILELGVGSRIRLPGNVD